MREILRPGKPSLAQKKNGVPGKRKWAARNPMEKKRGLAKKSADFRDCVPCKKEKDTNLPPGEKERCPNSITREMPDGQRKRKRFAPRSEKRFNRF